MRSHNSSPVAVEIYQFGKKGDWSYDALEKYTHLRYRLLPYIYSTSWEVTSKAGSIMRPLMMELPERQESARYGHRIYVRTQLPGSPGDGFIVYMARQEAKRSSERHEQNRKDRCLPSPRCPLDRLLDRANTGRRTDPAT